MDHSAEEQGAQLINSNDCLRATDEGSSVSSDTYEWQPMGHSVNEQGILKFYCPVNDCPRSVDGKKSFPRLAQLKQHFVGVHAKKIFTCNKCGKKFGLKDVCTRHEKECGKTIVCETCGASFKSKNSYTKHLKRKRHSSSTVRSSTTVPQATPVPRSSSTVPQAIPAPRSSTTVPQATPAPRSSSTIPQATLAPRSSTTVPQATPALRSSTIVPQATSALRSSTTVPQATPTQKVLVIFLPSAANKVVKENVVNKKQDCSTQTDPIASTPQNSTSNNPTSQNLYNDLSPDITGLLDLAIQTDISSFSRDMGDFGTQTCWDEGLLSNECSSQTPSDWTQTPSDWTQTHSDWTQTHSDWSQTPSDWLSTLLTLDTQTQTTLESMDNSSQT